MAYDADAIFGSDTHSKPFFEGVQSNGFSDESMIFTKPFDEVKTPSGSESIEKSDSDIIAKSNYSTPFKFSSEWLQKYSQTVFKYTSSGYMQIDIKALQNIAYLFCYGGLRTSPFYILDLCPSGAGKSENIKKQRDLLLTPIFKLQEYEHKKDLQRYYKEMEAATTKAQKSIPEPKMHKCIHTTNTSSEALFESFEAVSTQLIEFGELGLRLQKPDTTIDYICDGYGRSILEAPNYKNQRFKATLRVEDVSLFFIGDTNLQYLGKQAFYNHLQGGLINRCFIVFDNYIPDYEEIPEIYTLSNELKDRFNDIAIKIIRFAEKNKSFKISKDYAKNSYLKAYENNIHTAKKQFLTSGSVYGNLYHRSIQNLRAIIETLHLLKCFDNNLMEAHITDDTILEGIEFCKRYFDFEGIINELNGFNAEIIHDNKTDKVKREIELQRLPCSLRVLYRKLGISKKELMIILAEMGAKTDRSNVTSL